MGGVYSGETCVSGSCAVSKDVTIAAATAPAASAACHTAQSLPRERTRALGVGKRGRIDGWGVVVLLEEPQAAVPAWPEWSSAVCVAAGQQWPLAATRPLVRGRGRDGGAAAPGGRRELWIGDWCFIPEPQRQRLGSSCPPLGSCLLRLGWSDPFRHLQSASVVGAQICSRRMLMNQHTNATERRGHLGLKRRKSFERSVVFTSRWWLDARPENAPMFSCRFSPTHHPNRARG